MSTTPNLEAKTTLVDLALIDIPSDARPHDPEALEQLMRDMDKQRQLQEIIVAPVHGRFEVIAGVGRTLAARKLGWTQIRASVREGISEFDRARITFAENEDREEVDPFYQAYQITKMLRARGSTQQQLAKDLGISDALMSGYQAIDHLPASIKTGFRRLKLNQLIQIARLNREKSQVAFAEKCRNEELSVRQLKALIDRLVSKSQPSTKAKRPVDPLEGNWKIMLHLTDIGPQGSWKVRFGSQKDPNGKVVQGWNLWIRTDFDTPQESLKRWFLKMAELIGSTGGQRQNTPKPLGKTPAEYVAGIDRAMEEQKNARLPQNAQEQAEVEALGVQGPAAVAAWIYGQDSVLAKEATGTTWEDLDTTDPVEGVRKLLKEAQALKTFEPQKSN